MSKLATYDKYYSERDKKADDYYMRDYIYRKNISNRFSVVIGCALIIATYWINKIFNEDIDLLSVDYRSILLETISVVTAVLVVYSVVGFIKYSREYSQSKNRLRKYNLLLGKLERLKNNQSTEEDMYLRYEEFISNSRNAD